MRLATYQPITKKEKITSDYSEFERQLGFKPVFCISAENYEDLLVQSILAAPFCPQMIYFFETDDYHTFNVAEYNASKTDERYGDDNRLVKLDEKAGEDPRCLEYIVKEIPEDAVCYDLYDAVSDLRRTCFTPSDNQDKTKMMYHFLTVTVNTLADRTFKTIENFIKEDPFYKTHKVDEKYLSLEENTQGLLQVLKAGYESFGLYKSYCHWIGFEEIDMSIAVNDIISIVPALKDRIIGEYNPSKLGGKESTEESHIALYEDIKKYLRANNIMNITAFKKGYIGVNSKCPCGSGKKYKKCCKPYVVL